MLQRLGGSLEESEGAILKMDIAAMEAHAEEQKALCSEWRELDEAIRRHSDPAEANETPFNLWAHVLRATH